MSNFVALAENRKKKTGFTEEDLEKARKLLKKLKVRRATRIDQIEGTYASGVLCREEKKHIIK